MVISLHDIEEVECSKQDENTSICRLGVKKIKELSQSAISINYNDCVVLNFENKKIICRLSGTTDLASCMYTYDPLVSFSNNTQGGLNLENSHSEILGDKKQEEFEDNEMVLYPTLLHIPMESIILAKSVSIVVTFKVSAMPSLSLAGSLSDEANHVILQAQVQRLLKNKFVTSGCTIKPTHGATDIDFISILNMQPSHPNGYYKIAPTTIVHFEKQTNQKKKDIENTKESKHVGGLDSVYKQLKEIVLYPFLYPDAFSSLSIECPKGVLLYGPPGVGKTLIVSTIANQCKANLIVINGPSILSPFIGQSEANLREIFSNAQNVSKEKPTILFIDEIDALCPTREQGQTVESRIVAALLTLMDGANVDQDDNEDEPQKKSSIKKSSHRLCVIGATNRVNAIDPALRRPGRFDREIGIEVPDAEARYRILVAQTKDIPIDDSVDLRAIAKSCKGYVGADLASLSRLAANHAVMQNFYEQRELLNGFNDDNSKEPQQQQRRVTHADFVNATSLITPSLSKEYKVDVEKKTWEDVGGLDSVIESLKEAILWPLQYSTTYRQLGVGIPKGVLLHGPPGCSKTTLVKVLSSVSNCSFFSLSCAQIYSAYVGETEKAISEVVNKARQASPSIVFFDEIDAIACKRTGETAVSDRLLATLLIEMDGVINEGHVIFMAATNRLDMLDSALTRPGRFDRIIYIPLPNVEGRKKIFQVHTKKMPADLEVDIDLLAKLTPGYTGADIENVCKEAGLRALRRNILTTSISQKDFELVLEDYIPTLTAEEVEEYEKQR